MDNLQPHIKCKTGDVNENVILPGDPGRVPLIARFLSNSEKIQNNREYMTYNGDMDGVPITVISTGIGCPSTLIAMEELSKIGSKNFIRIGTCGGLKSSIKPGDIIIPSGAIKPDGEMLGHNLKNDPVSADKGIVEALISAAKKFNVKYHVGINRTHDSFYESTEDFVKLKGQNLVSSEMECAAIYLVAKLKGLKAGCVLVVNTYEPPEEVEKNPDIIYELSDENAVKKGMENAIKVVLEAFKILNNR